MFAIWRNCAALPVIVTFEPLGVIVVIVQPFGMASLPAIPSQFAAPVPNLRYGFGRSFGSSASNPPGCNAAFHKGLLRE